MLPLFAWRITNQYFPFSSSFKIIGTSAMKYGDLILEKVQKAGYYDEDEEFDITEKVNGRRRPFRFLNTYMRA